MTQVQSGIVLFSSARMAAAAVAMAGLFAQGAWGDPPGSLPPNAAGAVASKHDDIAQPPPGPVEVQANGFRRMHRSETRTLSPQQIQEFRNAGKAGALNGTAMTIETFTDYLPENWNANQNTGGLVDSYGNPIVNITPGVPDWAQRDVDGLRDAIADMLIHVENLELALNGQAAAITVIPSGKHMDAYLRGAADLQSDLFESRHVLGNFIGQAFTRRIDIADMIAIDDQTLPDETIDEVAAYLHFYEGLKMHEAIVSRQPFASSSYPPALVARLAQAGYGMTQVLSPDFDSAANNGSGDEGGTAGIIIGPLGCDYSTFSFGLGMTNLSGAAVLWDGGVSTTDDAQADISIGFQHYFWPCQDSDENTMLRVSTNGYATFFQQGGGALDGTDFTNDPLPSTFDPDGFIAPWWDDLLVTNQGSTDVIQYKIEGSTGSRVLTVEYFSVTRRLGDTSDFHYFQLKVMEGYTQVQCHYSSTLWIADSIDDATTGIEDFVGGEARCAGGNCTNTVSARPPNDYDFFFNQESNDNCASAICLEENEIRTDDNFGASGTDITSCAANDFADVWYRYTASATGTVTVSLCTTVDMDTTVAVYSSCGGAQLACDDDFCAFAGPSQTTFAATAGNTYLIRVAGYNAARGNFRIQVTGGASAGDVCSTCHAIANTFSGFTTNNSGCDNDSSCGGTGDIIDEWFCWTAPQSGTARADTCSATTDFDTTLAVYSGVCTLLTPIVCNDDSCGLQSRVYWNVQNGTQYKIRLAGFAGDTGNYLLTVGMAPCPADIAPAPNGDNQVGVADLLAVINGWGPCPGYCRADFMPPGGDHQIGVADLLGVINAWGSCP